VREERRSGCPINAGLEALGDPWALLVLRDIIFGDRRRFRGLLTQSEEGIASNILSRRLKDLVAAVF
jgi:DNA-binding HxlR family transcriptional regulator